MVSPPLHHSPTIRYPLRGVVGAPDFIPFNVRKLAFNPVRLKRLVLVEDPWKPRLRKPCVVARP